jgi:hypothetical protein
MIQLQIGLCHDNQRLISLSVEQLLVFDLPTFCGIDQDQLQVCRVTRLDRALHTHLFDSILGFPNPSAIVQFNRPTFDARFLGQ